MADALNLLLVSSLVLCMALFAEQALVPDVVAIAWDDDQQVWRVMTAFLLKAIQNIAIAVGLICLAGLAIMMAVNVNGSAKS